MNKKYKSILFCLIILIIIIPCKSYARNYENYYVEEVGFFDSISEFFDGVKDFFTDLFGEDAVDDAIDDIEGAISDAKDELETLTIGETKEDETESKKTNPFKDNDRLPEKFKKEATTEIEYYEYSEEETVASAKEKDGLATFIAKNKAIVILLLIVVILAIAITFYVLYNEKQKKNNQGKIARDFPEPLSEEELLAKRKLKHEVFDIDKQELNEQIDDIVQDITGTGVLKETENKNSELDSLFEDEKFESDKNVKIDSDFESKDFDLDKYLRNKNFPRNENDEDKK